MRRGPGGTHYLTSCTTRYSDTGCTISVGLTQLHTFKNIFLFPGKYWNSKYAALVLLQYFKRYYGMLNEKII